MDGNQRGRGNRAEGHGAEDKRLYITLTPDNYDYIRTVSRIIGTNMNDFINSIINSHRKTCRAGAGNETA